MLVDEVDCPSSAAAADPPVKPMPRRPLLLVVDVEVEPELLVWRGLRAEPTLVPTGAAMAREDRRAVRMTVNCMLAGDRGWT